MIELFEQDLHTDGRQSSKGNQLKWKNGRTWYKADYTGYEGLAEYLVSHLLQYSTLCESEYVLYEPEQIRYRKNMFNGVSSRDFLEDDWQIITLERLFRNRYNVSLYESLWRIGDVKERFGFLVRQVRNMTGLKDFDRYLNKLFTIDAVFLNEDRHMHNIAVLMNSKGEFDYCRIFDNGACFLSDTSMDYPLRTDIYELINSCHAKSISRDFDEQLEVSENAAGENLKFTFTHQDAEKLIDCIDLYSTEVKERVKDIIFEQMRKYQYLFTG